MKKINNSEKTGSSGLVSQMEKAQQPGISVCLFIQLNRKVEFIVYH